MAAAEIINLARGGQAGTENIFPLRSACYACDLKHSKCMFYYGSNCFVQIVSLKLLKKKPLSK
jgi:hypothetical protein